MDMRKYTGEKFLKVDDVRGGPKVGVIAVIRQGKYEKPDAVFESGTILSLNTTNIRKLIDAFGPNSDTWIGKRIRLKLGQIEFRGDWQDAILAEPDDVPF